MTGKSGVGQPERHQRRSFWRNLWLIIFNQIRESDSSELQLWQVFSLVCLADTIHQWLLVHAPQSPHGCIDWWQIWCSESAFKIVYLFMYFNEDVISKSNSHALTSKYRRPLLLFVSASHLSDVLNAACFFLSFLLYQWTIFSYYTRQIHLYIYLVLVKWWIYI